MKNPLQLMLIFSIGIFAYACAPQTNDLSETLILDLKFAESDHIAIIGNTLADRMQEHGWMETYIQNRFPQKKLRFRNLGFSGDELDHRQRSEDFGSPDEHLSHVKADIIFAFFGFNESFGGEKGLDKFRKDLLGFIGHTREQKYNGKTPPQLVLFSPIAHEDLRSRHLPDGSENNKRIEMYTQAMASVAVAEGVNFVNLFTLTKKMYHDNTGDPLTINGIHLNEIGNKMLGQAIDTELFGEGRGQDPEIIEKISAAVKDKNFHWFNNYRTVDGFNVFGGRSWLAWEGISNRDVMLREMEMFDMMTNNRDNVLWAAANGENYVVNDDNLPEPIIVQSYEKGKQTPRTEPYTYTGGEEAISKMSYSNELQVNLFASEEQFPDLINPVQMAFDTDERLWVVTWPTYPHWNPRGEMNDKILILPDENGDGKADEAIVWADGFNSITGFVFWNGGLVVAAPPELYFLKDTDGDDKADFKVRLLDGLSSADTHHSANSMVLGSDGALYYGRGIFNKVQLETPYGLFREGDRSPGIYRFDPLTFEYSLHFPLGANPHGDVFDQWGYQFATNATGGNGYYINIGKGQRARQFHKQRIRPVPGTAIISSEHFPKSYDGDFLICNVIGIQGIIQHDFVYEGADITAVENGPLLLSEDPNFRPTGAEIGGDGGLYILDWQNALIGHMQHNMRDPGRDHQHGRIYRMTAKRRPLLKPVKMKGKPISEILPHLRSKQNGTRSRVRTELTGRDSEKVLAEVDKFTADLDLTNPEDVQPLLECLWIYEMHRVINKELLEKVLAIPDAKTRSAGVRVLGHWGSKVDNGLALLKKAAADPEPFVRAQAVLASASFEGLEAAEIVFEVAYQPLDIQLNEQISYARQSLDTYWRQALKDGQKLSEAGEEFVLKNGSAEDIFKLDQTANVSRTLLVHQELPADIGNSALENLVKLTGKEKAAILLELIQSKADAGFGLFDLFTGLSKEELVDYKNRIWSVFSGRNSSSRARFSAATALMKIGEAPSYVYQKAVTSSKSMGAFLNAIQNNPDGKKRDEYYTQVKSMLFDKTEKLDVEVDVFKEGDSEPGNLGQLALVTLMNMPGHESEAFTDLNKLLEESKLEGVAINTLSELNTENLPESKIKTIGRIVLDYLKKIPPFDRDQESFYKGSKLLRKLSLRLSDAEYREIRAALHNMQMVEINIRTIPEKMRFDLKEFTVIAGQPVKINLINPDGMPHNLLVLNPGKAEEIGVAAGSMREGFVPDSKEILAASKLINEGETDVIKFMAPENPDDYDFICSFPGHWALMRGIMKVVPAEQGDVDKYRVVYKGEEGPGKGKNIVFITTDHEYRSEETLPALARILSKRYGFNCTVVWGLDDEGNILPGSSNIRGLEVLEDADLMVIFTRFSNFMDEQMEYIDDYLERGGPVIGLRTATHAFSNKANAKWEHYSHNYNGPKKAWKDGFGEMILGETWVGHYGKNHEQASKLIIEANQKDHPIMRGVKDAWAQCGGYQAYPERKKGIVLARGRVLNGMTPDAEPDKSKKELPVAWVRNYQLESGASGRVFTTTHGASEDLMSDGFRRMLVNACFWGVEMEDDIKEDNNIEFVGEYKPTTFNFKGYKANVKPSDLAGWESIIMPGEIVKKDKQQ